MPSEYARERAMSDQPGNLVLELLRAIRGDMAEMRAEQREHRTRLGAIARSLAHVERDGAESRAELRTRLDRIHDRLDGIEGRLTLTEA